MPPLRERREDIPVLTKFYLARYNKTFSRNFQEISPAALELMESYDWPGNIRELKNVVRRATLLAPGEVIEPEQIDFISRGKGGGEPSAGAPPVLRDAVSELERTLIRQALERTGGNKSRAAELLGISYPSLLSKFREYRLGE